MTKKFVVFSLALIFIAIFGGATFMMAVTGPAPARAAGLVADTTGEQPPAALPPLQDPVCSCSEDSRDCQESFATFEEAQACYQYCQSLGFGDVHHLDRDNDGIACENLEPSEEVAPFEPTATPVAEPAPPAEEAPPTTSNVVKNGDFEFGFYQVPQLGYEAPDVGNVPFSWTWFKSDAYGKYDIDNNETFALVCPDNIILGTEGRNALGMYMQSTDQPDARLGVYQTVDVTPGLEYLFSISGTIQVQPGGSSPDINNRIQVAFDQAGGTDWRAIPDRKWTRIPWREQELEFQVSGEDDPDLAQVENYFQVVEAESNQMTIFLTAWRKWPNWRTSVFTFDCVSLAPLNQVNVAPIVPELAGLSVTTVDEALAGGQTSPQGAEPAVVSEPAPDAGAAGQPPVIPDAGGVPEKKNSLWVTLVSVVVLSGLVVAGLWNARRQK